MNMDIGRIVYWCNTNQGFFSAVLSIIGLLLSLIAIFVSIKAARMPYKKKVLLGRTFDYVIGGTEMYLSVFATNIGNRDIYIKFLGLGIKKGCRMQNMIPINSVYDSRGKISPSETKEMKYNARDLMPLKENYRNMLYIVMSDSEGKNYKKRIGKIGKNLSMFS